MQVSKFRPCRAGEHQPIGNVVAPGICGFVYLFQRSSGGTWSQIQKLSVPEHSSSSGGGTRW